MLRYISRPRKGPNMQSLVNTYLKSRSFRRNGQNGLPWNGSARSGCNGIFNRDPSKDMLETKVELQSDVNPQETTEWMEALDGVVEENGPERAAYLLGRLIDAAAKYGVETPHKLTTPYVNTIPVEEEVAYPGDRE